MGDVRHEEALVISTHTLQPHAFPSSAQRVAKLGSMVDVEVELVALDGLQIKPLAIVYQGATGSQEIKIKKMAWAKSRTDPRPSLATTEQAVPARRRESRDTYCHSEPTGSSYQGDRAVQPLAPHGGVSTSNSPLAGI